MVKNVSFSAVAIASSTYNYTDSKSNPSILRTSTIPRKSPRKRKFGVDVLVLFQATDKIVDIHSQSEQNLPENSRLLYLKYDDETGIFPVHEYISVDINLHLRLSYHGCYTTSTMVFI